MLASEQITIAPHLTFDAIAAGTPGAPLLLHGKRVSQLLLEHLAAHPA